MDRSFGVRGDRTNEYCDKSQSKKWPERPNVSPELMTPIEAAIFLRLDENQSLSKKCRLNFRLLAQQR
jgi:hypothetical protein